MLVTCPECQKKLKVADTSAGKKVRCPQCKALISVPALEADADDEPPPPTKPAKPKEEVAAGAPKKPAKPKPPVDDDDDDAPRKPAKSKPPVDDDDDDAPDDAPADAMRCAKCKSAAVEELPPNAFSRQPGYVCKKCGAKMRPRGTTPVYIFVMAMGVFIILFGLAIITIVFLGETQRPLGMTSTAGVTIFAGFFAIAWGFKQILMPVPINAPLSKARVGLMIAVFLVIFLVVPSCVGCLLFSLMYYMQEVM